MPRKRIKAKAQEAQNGELVYLALAFALAAALAAILPSPSHMLF